VTKRVLSTAVLWAVVIAVLWFFRSPGAVVLLGALSFLALREFYQLLDASGEPPFLWTGASLGALITVSPWLGDRYGDPSLMLALATVVIAVRMLVERTPENRTESLAGTLFGLVYVAFLMQFIVRMLTPSGPLDLMGPDDRLLLTFWFVVVVKFCDTGALLAGTAFGKHLMAPRISPKKTWEGLAGGVIVSMSVGALGAWILREHVPAGFTPGIAALIAAPLALAGAASDLVKSVVKRRANRKDSGTSVPGIGGVLDLIDSLLLAAPLGYLLLPLG